MEKLLQDIDSIERDEALNYYRDYFEDAGSEHEQEVIDELGTPEKVAQTIKEGLDINEQENEEVIHHYNERNTRILRVIIVVLLVLLILPTIGGVGGLVVAAFGLFLSIVCIGIFGTFGLLCALVALVVVAIKMFYGWFNCWWSYLFRCWFIIIFFKLFNFFNDSQYF